MKAAVFVAIIVLGYTLKSTGFFKEGDFDVISKIVLKIALPAAIVSNFAGGGGMEVSLLFLSFLGFLGGAVYVAAAFFLSAGEGKKNRPFLIQNLSGYNIGNFTMPFAQSFLGTSGVVATSLFDAGNALICLGGSYSIARGTKNEMEKISVSSILKALLKSVPFDTQMIMVILTLLHIKLPVPVVSFAGVIANANAFLAMLMIGVGFQLSGDKKQIGKIVKILSVRYGIAAFLAVLCFVFLPLKLEYRQTLVILFFSPIASSSPAFTAELNEDVGLSSAVNSISIVISIIIITTVLMVLL